MTTYGYARAAAGSTGPQEAALLAEGCTRVFTDIGQHRGGWQICLDALRPGDTLMVWSLDRLGRNMPGLQQAVDALQERGARLTVLKEPTGVELAELRARIAALGTTCPPWCGRESEHDLHTRRAGRAGDVSVSLVLDDAWDRPRLLVMHYRTAEDQSAVLLPLNEAEDMAALMAHLGHGDVAGLVREASAGLKAAGQP